MTTARARPISRPISSWGRTTRAPHLVCRPGFLDEAIAQWRPADAPILAHGLGRSYGDSCLNAAGRLLLTDRLDRLRMFDVERGLVRAEAGMSLDALLRVIVPRGWFLPVTPGTKFVTLGGAVANDVHGKNHEKAGTFGAYVTRLGLARSTGEVLTLSPDENADLFAATIGGLGLTGLITCVELKLAPIRSAFLDAETLPFGDLDGFFRLADESRDWPYTVAWVDCLAGGAALGRGLFMRGRWSETGGLAPHRAPRVRVPLDAPSFLLGSPTMRTFNALYRVAPRGTGVRAQHYDPFFYPLDAIGNWNRLYGTRGFFQHQCVVPMSEARETLRRMLDLTASHRQGSFLAVLKLFGDVPSPGVLSFPRAGATLALDLPNRGEATTALLERLTAEVMRSGGRLYPAKDATMTGEAFRAGFPRWREVEAARDPAVRSDFWSRVTGDAA